MCFTRTGELSPHVLFFWLLFFSYLICRFCTMHFRPFFFFVSGELNCTVSHVFLFVCFAFVFLRWRGMQIRCTTTRCLRFDKATTTKKKVKKKGDTFAYFFLLCAFIPQTCSNSAIYAHHLFLLIAVRAFFFCFVSLTLLWKLSAPVCGDCCVLACMTEKLGIRERVSLT